MKTQNKEVNERLASFGIDVLKTSPAESKRFFLGELDKWAKVVKASGIQIE